MPDAVPILIRPATAADAPALMQLIRELARYERLEEAVSGTAEDLAAHLAVDPPAFEALLAMEGRRPVGVALYFPTYSTFLCRPGIHLEDLYVLPEVRGRGVGRRLLQELARIAMERGCGRLEWDVLDWNEPALAFYRSLAAAPVDGWTRYRLTGEALAGVAQPVS